MTIQLLTKMQSHRAPYGTKHPVEGYASKFGKPDSGGDIIMPGAFAASLARRKPGDIRMLFQHDPKEPIGVWTQVYEDAIGLKVIGHLIGTTQRGAEIDALIRADALDGLSIGFRTIKATRDRGSGLRRLWHLDLWEISIVTFPMMSEARITKITT